MIGIIYVHTILTMLNGRPSSRGLKLLRDQKQTRIPFLFWRQGIELRRHADPACIDSVVAYIKLVSPVCSLLEPPAGKLRGAKKLRPM